MPSYSIFGTVDIAGSGSKQKDAALQVKQTTETRGSRVFCSKDGSVPISLLFFGGFHNE
jgi:hypothetical protein